MPLVATRAARARVEAALRRAREEHNRALYHEKLATLEAEKAKNVVEAAVAWLNTVGDSADRRTTPPTNEMAMAGAQLP